MSQGTVLNVYLACMNFQEGKLEAMFNRLSTLTLSPIFSALRDISDMGAIRCLSSITEFYH